MIERQSHNMPHPTMPALFPNAWADAQGLARRI